MAADRVIPHANLALRSSQCRPNGCTSALERLKGLLKDEETNTFKRQWWFDLAMTPPAAAMGREGKAVSDMFERITFNPNIMGGRACIRGLRMTVSMVVNLAANGMTTEEILKEYADLEPEDVRQTP